MTNVIGFLRVRHALALDEDAGHCHGNPRSSVTVAAGLVGIRADSAVGVVRLRARAAVADVMTLL